MHNGAEEMFIREDCLDLYRCFDENQVEEMIKYVTSPPKESKKTIAQLKYS